MIQDLSLQPGNVTAKAGLVVIGGGIAGLLLATRLRERNIPVLLLESGGPAHTPDPDGRPHPLNEVVLLEENYRGAMEGRARCLGGTSVMWGGALIPFLPEDLEARPHVGAAAWPVRYADVAPYVSELEQLFGIDRGSYEEAFVHAGQRSPSIPTGDADFRARFAKWPDFKRRNLANLFRNRIDADPDLTVWLNATVTDFDLDAAAGRVDGIMARHASGRTLRVAADRFVIAAGAIEATRLLLLLDRQSGGRAFAGSTALGRYFHDHVSAHAADIGTGSPLALNRMAGFRFVGSTMRSLRFELTPGAQAAERVGSGFGHISFQATKASGFDALRTLMRGLQRTGRLDTGAILQLVRDFPYLAKAGYWRYVHNQLRWPEPSRYELHIVAEQAPQSTNRITLASATDPLGTPRAAIDWRIGPQEHATLAAFARRFAAFWQRQGLEAAGALEWLPGLRSGEADKLQRIGDVFHPGGTTRMGNNGESAVVDSNLRVFAVPNVWIASTSVFPSGASANPTMMLMLFTMRLADHLANPLAGSRLG